MRTAISSLAMLALVTLLGAASGGAPAQPALVADPWTAGREGLVAFYDQMPEAALRQAFLRCDREASRRMMDFAEGVHCAVAWDTLLRRDYAGNVDKLLDWWRKQRIEAER
jgi:hypothetical protein